jgi:hypothetical protein
VGLILAIGLLAGIGAGGVHQGDDGQRPLRAHLYALRGRQMMLGHPHAVPGSPVLGDEAHGARLTGEIHLDGGRVERPVGLLFDHPTELADHFRRRCAARVFGARDDRLDVGVDIELGEPITATQDLALTEQARQRFVHVCGGKEREILCQALGDEKEPVPFHELFVHCPSESGVRWPVL